MAIPPPPSTAAPPPLPPLKGAASEPPFNIEDFKSRMRGFGEMEKFLVDELPDENELPKKMVNIREKFKEVLGKIHKVEDESKRREYMYHLVNLFTHWNQIKIKHKFNLERLHYEHHLKGTLTQMLEAMESSTSVTVAPVVVAAAEEVNFPDNLLECRWTSRYSCPPKVHGLKQKIKFMERLLVKKTKEDGMFGSIAIIGIPGVGKSTLALVMLNNEKVKKHYPFQLWVCLSKQDEEVVVEENGGLISRKVEILKRMLICLGHDDDVVEGIIKDDRDEGKVHNLIYAIKRQLKGKKYIIVLDDASDVDLDFLQNLSDPSSEDGKTYKMMADVLPRDPGGMVIVTTRSEKAAKKIVGEKNVHELPLLEHKNDCWKIFKDTVEQGRKFPEEDEDIKELITAKCASVPLAAKMMGLIMLHQIKEREKKKRVEKPQEQSQQLPTS